MAITYTQFLTQVRNYTEVGDTVLTDTLIDQFLTNVELNVAGKVDYDDLRKYSTSNFIAGQRYLTMPADFVLMRSMETIISGNRNFLEKRDQTYITEYNESGASGVPVSYAMWDEFTAVVAPIPASTYQVQINYIIDPPHFTASNNTYLSQHQQSILLYGVLTEAFSYLKGPLDMYKLYSDKYNEEIQAFALQQMGRRRRDDFIDGVPRIKIDSPSPS